MRVVGLCTGCRRFRYVYVSAAGLARAFGGVFEGLCVECEVAEAREREGAGVVSGLRLLEIR